jgi:hypothetical protein
VRRHSKAIDRVSTYGNLAHMSTPRTVTWEYATDPDAVAALLRDPDFLKRRCEEAGEKNVEVTVEDNAYGLRVIVARDKQVELPSFAKRLFTPKNRVVDDVCWKRQGERWVGEYTLEITGVPGDIRGRSTLFPSSSGTRHESSFEVTARVPLLGSKIESFVADRIEETFRDHAARNAARLK